MQFDMEALPPRDRYKILTSTVTPRPIAWVTSQSASGILNAAPFSFFNVMDDDPPVVVLGIMRHPENRPKDTGANIQETGEFVINLVTEDLADAMNITCMDAPPEVDELACAGLTPAPSVKVKPPRIAESPVNFECRTFRIVETAPHQMIVIGRVIMAHIRDDMILDPERCHIDTPRLRLIGRMHGSGWYARTSDLFELKRPRYADWAAAQQSRQDG